MEKPKNGRRGASGWPWRFVKTSSGARRKPAAARMDVDVAYTGFDIEDEFVIGYGLDYAEKYRNLPFIGTLAPHVYKGEESSGAAGEAAPEAPSGPPAAHAPEPGNRIGDEER